MRSFTKNGVSREYSPESSEHKFCNTPANNQCPEVVHVATRTLFSELLRIKYGKRLKNVLDPQLAELIPGFISNSFKL